jgi:hypothetical protein
VIDSQAVGRVYNTKVDEGKLKAEAWLDEEKLRTISPIAYGYIQQGHPLDVSIGVFTDDEFVAGNWNGEDSGYQEEQASIASEIVEKANELIDLINELNGTE